MAKHVQAVHGVVCRMPERKDGYFGWPSVAVLADGTLAVGASGLRRHHIDPWGKTVLWYGNIENGFGEPVVIHNSPLDDCDVGLTALPGGGLLAAWFSLDPRIFREQLQKQFSPEEFAQIAEGMDAVDDETAIAHQGSWTQRSDDGGKTWHEKKRSPLSTPHGPIVLSDGRLLYLGKQFPAGLTRPFADVACAVSEDNGDTWQEIGVVPLPEGTNIDQFHEPHVAECADGTLRGYIRYHYPEEEGGNLGIFQTKSTDGGKTWTMAEDMGIHGSPPHILKHSSGAWVMVYGWRHPGYGQRAKISMDEGKTWGEELILRDDGPDGDLGYPCSVELADGSIFTVYYQKAAAGEKTSILWTKWNIE